MTTIRKKIISIETWQRTVIRYSTNLTKKFYCQFCVANVETITLEQSAAIFNLSLHEIYQGIENGKLHFIVNKNQICLNSLQSYTRKKLWE